MLKKLVLLAVLSLLAVGLVSAQAEVTIPETLPEGVTITYWHEWDGAQLEAITQIIANFNENNEYGITVETVELGSTGPMREQVSTGIVSGELPNLVGGFASDAQSWFLEGVTVPLDPYLADPTWGFSEAELANINQDVLAVNRVASEPFNDALLAWPIGYSAVVMSANLALMNELGFDGAPETLEAFREVACAAAEYTGPAGEDVQGFPLRTSAQDMHAFILSQGGSIWDDAAQQFDFDNQTVIDTVTFFQQLVADGCAYLPETNFANTADFAASLNPMAVGSSVGVPFIRRDAAAAAEAGGTPVENWINTTTPWSEGNRTLVMNYRSVIMLGATPEEQLATWLFIKHLASDESQRIWTELTLYQPYTQSGLEVISEEWLADNPQFASIRELLLDDSVAKVREPQLLGYFQGAQVFSEVIAAAATDANLDVAAALAEAEVRANEVLAEQQEAIQ